MFYSLVYREQPTLCPGEVCEPRARLEVQQASILQVLILLAFAGLVVAGTVALKDPLSSKPHPLFGAHQRR